MTRLEEEISISIVPALCKNGISPEEVAQAAAEVCKRYIEKAYHAASAKAKAMAVVLNRDIEDLTLKELGEFLKKEGVTE